MHVLMLGNSEIGRRRVLPALARNGVRRVDIASRSNADGAAWPAGMTGAVFGDYAEAIAASTAELVWISTVNSLHADLAKAALAAGRHVVVDKPLALCLDDARALAGLARERRLVLAEATVYADHPQIEAARRVFRDAGSAPTQLIAAFSFPPLPPGNFRHRPELGGGALLDLAPYAMSLGRVFLDAPPDDVIGRKFGHDDGFSLLALYPGGRSVTGHFGAATGYVNRLTLLGPDVTVTLERAFTSPPDLACRLSASVANAPVTLEIPAADSFALFLGRVFAAIRRRDGEDFLTALLADAEATARLKASTG